MRHESVSNLFSELAYDPDSQLIYCEDGMLGFVFRCSPMFAADDSVTMQLAGVLSQDWPKDSYMQWHLFSSPDIARNLNKMMRLRNYTDELLYAAALERSAFLEKGLSAPLGDENAPLVKDTQLIISSKVPCSNPPTQSDIDAVSKLRTSVMSALKAVGMGLTPLDAKEYVRLMQTMLNWREDFSWLRPPNEFYNEEELIKEQFFDTETAFEASADTLKLGRKFVRTLSPKQYPSQVHLGIPANYIMDTSSGGRGIKGNYLLTASVYFPDSENKREMMNNKRNWVLKNATGPLLKFVPRLAQQHKSFEALFNALDEGDKAVELNLTLSLFADTEDELTQAVSNAKTYYRTLGFQMMEDKFFNLPVFLNALPLGADPKAKQALNRYTTMATRHASLLLPFLGDWKGTWTPLMTFISRSGQLMNMDLFDSASNYNAVIAAASGAGKSFVTNEIICSYLASGERVWVIDVGYSYKKLCDVLGGVFIEFSEGRDICLNPFDVIKNFKEEINMLVGLLTAMAAPNEKLSDLQLAIMRRTLNELWDKHGHDLTIDLVAKQLIETGLAEQDSRIADIGNQLYPFTSTGEFGQWFNGRNNLDVAGNSFVVLELEQLKAKPELQRVVLLQLIYQIQQEMYLGSREQRKVMIIDEAWSLIGSDSGAVGDFVETGYRRFRKYNGCAITITQGINDLYNTSSGAAIAENSATTMLLKQKGQTIDSIRQQQRLPLNNAGYDLLKTVHTRPGHYSEIFFLTDAGAGIGRLIVSRFQQLMYSTNPNEVSQIEELMRNGLSLKDAIESIVQYERSQGYSV